MEELMLKIENVKKEYKLGQIGGTTLRDELQRLHAKIHKKEDPTKKIGAKNYNQGETFLALDGVSFEVKKGERVGIIGHNGAGKSTLLKLISRITAPTEGTISLNGRIASMLEVGTGFHPELTGRENVYMNGAILGMTKKEIDAKMEDIIEFSEVRQFIDTPVKRYSSGMYVKLAFAVAAHLDSEIMIMDEVLAVGDMKFQEKCIGKMSDVSKNDGRTILYVSHNMNTIRQLCNRVVVLDHGRVFYDGNVTEAIQIYMSANKLSSSIVSLKGLNRLAEFSDQTVSINSLRVDTNDSIFETGDLIDIEMSVDSKKEIGRARVEFVLRSADGVPVTRFLSAPNIFLTAEHENIIRMRLDISSIAPGKYSFSPIIREVNSWGTFNNLDGYRDAYFFQINAKKGFNGGTFWNPTSSGFFVVPEIQLLEIV